MRAEERRRTPRGSASRRDSATTGDGADEQATPIQRTRRAASGGRTPRARASRRDSPSTGDATADDCRLQSNYKPRWETPSGWITFTTLFLRFFFLVLCSAGAPADERRRAGGRRRHPHAKPSGRGAAEERGRGADKRAKPRRTPKARSIQLTPEGALRPRLNNKAAIAATALPGDL